VTLFLYRINKTASTNHLTAEIQLPGEDIGINCSLPGFGTQMKADGPGCVAQIVKMGYVGEDVPHTNFKERNFGGSKITLEGLPGSFVAVFCGGSPLCLEDINDIAWEVLEGVEPPQTLQATR
jgi:hypothetical protein